MALLRFPQDKDAIKQTISKLDYSNALVPNCTSELLKSTCDDALRYGFAAVAVFPVNMQYVCDRLKGTDIAPELATGFPSGNHLTAVKLREAELGLEMGVREIDMVMNISKLCDGDFNYVLNDTAEMVKLAKGYNVGVKLIIETGFLTDAQKLDAGRIAIEAGCEFIKTCTGFGPGRATMHDISLLVDNFGDKIKIKASGGVASIDDGWSFIQLGASRIAGRHAMVEQLEAMGYRP